MVRQLCFQRVKDGAILPTKNHPTDAGFDLYAHCVEDLGDYIKVYTGIAASPPKDFYLMLASRSSIYKRGLILQNGVGIIDPGYTGEIVGIFKKNKDYKPISVGERVMQIVPHYSPSFEAVEVKDLPTLDRGDKGFGSSGL